MRAGGRFGATSCVRRCLVYRRHRASSCRRANPIEPGWRRQRLLEVFLAGAAIWRTGCHRRTLLICLHACAGRHSAQPNLRHIESSPRLAPVVVDSRTGRIFRSRDATRAVAAAYPASVRAWIRQNGGLTQKLIFLRGRQLAALYPRC